MGKLENRPTQAFHVPNGSVTFQAASFGSTSNEGQPMIDTVYHTPNQLPLEQGKP